MNPPIISSEFPLLIAFGAFMIGSTLMAQGQSITNQPDSAALALASDSGFDGKLTGGWEGERQRLEQKGISFNAQLVLEGFGNATGGVDTGVTGASTFDLNLALDAAKAFNWQGGEFYADLEDHAGRNPSTALAGDLQVFDKLNSDSYLQIFELWYQQELFNGWLRLKAGKIDANTEFSVIDNGLPFLNASTQVTPTILPFPTTPDPMPGVNLFFTPAKAWYASFGVFYANRSDTFGDLTGHPQSIQPTASGTLLIAETGLRWDQAPVLGADGNFKVGVWGHTGTYERLQGGRQNGSGGYYAVFDQTLWHPAGKPDQGARTFLEAGHAQPSVSAIAWNTTGGLTWTGLFADDDVLGFSANYAHLSPDAGLPHSFELALEGLYQVSVSKWATVMPDFQFIIHPGGQYPDAAVGTLDLTIQF
ncbi:MAG: carbohydrate porin [Limisphaerales bacterium]